MRAEEVQIDLRALEALAALLLDRAGLKITPDGYYGLRLALQARLPALGLRDASAYVARLEVPEGEGELRALLPLVTVGKTEFFRDGRQFEAFERTVFPAVLEAGRADGRQVRLWSAGCATGEEPYSLAMVAREHGADAAEVDIWATDLNPVAAETAALGVYPGRRLVGISDERRRRFFVDTHGRFEVAPDVRALVRFESHNLAAPVWPKVAAGAFDVIFCRNVIIYFDQPTIIGVMERFYEGLRPGGWLFLGYSESLFKISTRFEMVEVGGTFAYQRPVRGERLQPTTIFERAIGAGAHRSPTDVETVLRELRRREPPPPPLVPRAPPRPSAPRPPTPPVAAAPPRPAPSSHLTPVERLAAVVAAVEAGDFVGAVSLAEALVADEPDDLAAQLTLANVHALVGQVGRARELYLATLAREPLCVEAHLFLALAALQARQVDEARLELTRALFLEPDLALGHYLLGQVHERGGQAEAARRSYRNAIALQKAPWRELLGHFPDLPGSNDDIARAARYRLAELSER